MAQTLFVAYSRTDVDAVAELVADARSLDYRVLLDDGLPGGPTWWADVLERVAGAQVFVYAVSVESLDSEACRAQHRYAVDLGLPVLPVLVGDGVGDALVPPDLARLQRVDYRDADKAALGHLHRAIERLEVAPPRDARRPDIPPDVAIDLHDLAEVGYLDPSRQQALVRQLRTLAAAGVPSGRLRQVVAGLRDRPDLTVRADAALAELLETLGDRPGPAPALRSDDVGREPPRPGGPAPRELFLSYSRADARQVAALARDLDGAGFDVWLDQELPGGAEWWDEVLQRIRAADAFLFVASAGSLDSRACVSELEYARALGKPVLAVAVHESGVDPDAFPTAPAPYGDGDKTELAAVVASLRRARTPPLPDPLPTPPEIPATYLFDIRSEIRAQRVLSPQEQMAIVAQLEGYAAEDVPARDIARLVAEMRERDDLTVPASRSLDDLRLEAGIAAETARDTGGAPAAGTSRDTSGGHAADTSRDTGSGSAASEAGRATARDAVAPPRPPPPPPEPEVGPSGDAGTAPPAGGRPWESATASDGDGASSTSEAHPPDAPARDEPRRRGRLRRGVGVAAMLLVVVAIAVQAIQDDAGSDDGAFDRSDASELVDGLDRETPEPEDADPIDADLADVGPVRTLDASWSHQGVFYEARLSLDGPTGEATVTYDDPTGLRGRLAVVQDVTFGAEGGTFFFQGANPRDAATGAPVVYVADRFVLGPGDDGTPVVAMVCSVGGCAPTFNR